MATAPARDPVAGVLEADAAGRHQLHLRQRAAQVLEVPRARAPWRGTPSPRRRRPPRPRESRSARSTRASRPRRRRGMASMTAGLNTGLTMKRAPARMAARAVSGSRIVPAPMRKPAGSVGAISLDELDGPRHGHRHLERRDAACGQRVDDRAELRPVLQPDHRHNTAIRDLPDRRRSRAVLSHVRPPLPGEPAAVDHEDVPVDVVAGRRTQEHGRAANIGRAHPSVPPESARESGGSGSRRRGGPPCCRWPCTRVRSPFTLMRCAAHSLASAFVSCASPPLAAA